MLVTGTPALPISISEARYEAELAPSSEPPPGHPEDSERVQGDQLVRAAPTPVDDLGLPGAARRAPPASPRLPAAVRPPEAEQVGESVVHALVVELAEAAEHEQRLQDVVMPVRRVVERQPAALDHLAGAERAKESMAEEELRRPPGCLLGPSGTGGAGVFVEPPDRQQRLVERRAAAARLPVTVPAAVWPLPLDERAG